MTLEVKFTEIGAEDYDFWEKADQRTLDKINMLVRDAREHPFTGIGKPEPLKFDLAGCWSRRITREHRLVYSVESGFVVIHQCRFHYTKRKK